MSKQSDYIKRHKSWQVYAKQQLAKGKKPIPFKDWKPELKSKNTRTKAINKGLKAAGIDWNKDKPSAKYKRSK